MLHIFVTDKQPVEFKYMKTEINNSNREVSQYKLIQHLITQAEIEASEDKGSLRYENKRYYLGYDLSGEAFEVEFMIDGENVQLDEPELDLLFLAVEKEIENERINAFYNSMDDTHDFINANFHTIY